MGDIVTCIVTRQEPFGVFVELDSEIPGLLEVVNMTIPKSGTLKMDNFPKVGEKVRVKIIQFADQLRQVRVSERALEEDLQ